MIDLSRAQSGQGSACSRSCVRKKVVLDSPHVTCPSHRESDLISSDTMGPERDQGQFHPWDNQDTDYVFDTCR